MFRAFFSILCVVLAMGGCKRDEQPQDYYPMAKGNRWVYATGDHSDRLTYEVDASVRMSNGENAWRMVRNWDLPSKSLLMVDSIYIVKRENEVVGYSSLGDTTPDVLLRFPLEVGKNWVVSSRDKYTISVTVTALEAVNVSGKTFKRCFKLESSRNEQDSVVASGSEWYAPGVGNVMTIIRKKSHVRETKLVDYTVH